MDNLAANLSIRNRTSIFDESWWFDAVCPGAWGRREIWRDGVCHASIAFHHFRRYGFRYLAMPSLTRTLEPFLNPDSSKPVGQRQRRVALLKELLAALPGHDRFDICLPPQSELALPFSLLGFRHIAAYTFRHDGRSLEDTRQAMDKNTRQKIAAAQKRIAVDPHEDLDRYIRLSRVRARSSGQDRSDYGAIRRAFDACLSRGRTAILSAVDEAGRDVAATILIWDSEHLYYWLTARDDDLCGHGDNSLLIWEVLRLAEHLGCQLDLDGFITPEHGLFLSRFGLQPEIRHCIGNVNRLWDGLADISGLFKGTDGRIAYR